VIDAPIFHLALPGDWRQAREAGLYRISTRGVGLADDGFIHCSFAHQLEPVARAWYDDLDELVILHLDPVRLPAEIRVEPASDGSGQRYPHVYGPIPTSAVIDVIEWTRRPGQTWMLPAEVDRAP
jgi:uncharacterized protein (DUF952 family)